MVIHINIVATFFTILHTTSYQLRLITDDVTSHGCICKLETAKTFAGKNTRKNFYPTPLLISGNQVYNSVGYEYVDRLDNNDIL